PAPNDASQPRANDPATPEPRPRRRIGVGGFLVGMIVSAVATALVLALLVNIFTRKQEARVPFQRVVEVTEHTTDPEPWGANWPHQYDSYLRTVDHERTRYGGS